MNEYEPIDDREWSRLAQAALDGELSSDDAARFSDEIASNAARAADYARLAMLHDALERELNAAVEGRAVARRTRVIARFRHLATVAAAIALASGLAWLALRTTPEASAADIVARLVAAARSGDRTYFVRAVEDNRKPSRTADKPREQRPARDARPQPSIDGAILYVRAPNLYVLARVDESGAETITGCDGSRAWIVPPSGPVRVSRDPKRFSGALPGSQQGIVFIDPHLDLGELAQSYELKLVPAATPGVLARIEGARRSDARGGPKRVELAYEESTALIRSIRLDNLPQARGGPRTVEFELIDDERLPDDFFRNTSHHDASRVVITED
jgi:hypothetical protein